MCPTHWTISFFFFFFFNDTATTEIYTLSLHDALPISRLGSIGVTGMPLAKAVIAVSIFAELPGQSGAPPGEVTQQWWNRSEEHTSELQSQSNLVCRLLLEKKKQEQAHEPRHKSIIAAR